MDQLSSSPRLKPTMGEMSGFNPEMKRLYLSKRKKVGLLATQKWGAGNFPKFNTPEMKTQLKAFASDIEGECSIPEIGFTSDAICQHIQDYFNEQRRYKKRNGQQPVREHVKRKTSAISQSCGKKFRATCTLDKTPPEQDNAAQNLTDSGESLSTLSPYDSSDSESPMTPTGASSPSEIKVPSTLTSSQVVIKAVFGKLLTREKSVDILKSKFDVKKSNLTNLTPTVK